MYQMRLLRQHLIVILRLLFVWLMLPVLCKKKVHLLFLLSHLQSPKYSYHSQQTRYEIELKDNCDIRAKASEMVDVQQWELSGVGSQHWNSGSTGKPKQLLRIAMGFA